MMCRLLEARGSEKSSLARGQPGTLPYFPKERALATRVDKASCLASAGEAAKISGKRVGMGKAIITFVQATWRVLLVLVLIVAVSAAALRLIETRRPWLGLPICVVKHDSPPFAARFVT